LEQKLNSTPPVFGITGWKNSGKTTLMERLIEEFTIRGLVVSAVKHAHHSFDIDHVDRDSYKFRSAGARRTAIVSRNRWAMIHELREEDEPPLAEILRHIGSCDLILVEGYKRESTMKIEVRNLENNSKILSTDDPNIVAVAFQGTMEEEVLPSFDVDNVSKIADFIQRQVM
jgi:molybdopterin-guanine dinucleotide biosynthesis protein B